MMRMLALALLASCQIPLRAGVAVPTRHGFGSAGAHLTAGATATKDVDTARVGGGAVLHVTVNSAPTTYQVAAQGHADIVLRRGYERQLVLATRLDAGLGSELLASDSVEDPRTVYSFGAFIGPGLAYEPSRRASDLTWDTIALGLTARRTTIGDESTWFVGAAFEFAYAIDFDRFSRSSSP